MEQWGPGCLHDHHRTQISAHCLSLLASLGTGGNSSPEPGQMVLCTWVMAWAAYLLPTESGHCLVPGDPLLLGPALMVAPLALSDSAASVLAS